MSHNRGQGRVLTDDEIEQLKTMSGFGMPMEQMAAVFKMSQATLATMVKKDERVADAINSGRAVASYNARSTAFKMANGYARPRYDETGKVMKDEAGNEIVEVIPPDGRMLQFWLKTRERFAERIEISGEDGGPIVMSREARKQKIEELKEFLSETE